MRIGMRLMLLMMQMQMKDLSTLVFVIMVKYHTNVHILHPIKYSPDDPFYFLKSILDMNILICYVIIKIIYFKA